MKIETIDELLETEGYDEVCSECLHYREWTESHPYGMTTASETLAECTAPSDGECPRLQKLTEDEK